MCLNLIQSQTLKRVASKSSSGSVLFGNQKTSFHKDKLLVDGLGGDSVTRQTSIAYVTPGQPMYFLNTNFTDLNSGPQEKQ